MPDEKPKPFSINPIYIDPVVLIALLILLSIFVLIGFAMIGWDKGVLIGMGRIEFARGLITYLFAVVTIGTAVVLVVSALTGTEDEVHEKRFQRGKEILALLLGVFGTIVGFYFGSEMRQKPTESLMISKIHLSTDKAHSGESIVVQTHISGGQAPYKYGIGFDNEEVDTKEVVAQDGWIEKKLTTPTSSIERTVEVHFVAVDSAGSKSEAYSPVAIKP